MWNYFSWTCPYYYSSSRARTQPTDFSELDLPHPKCFMGSAGSNQTEALFPTFWFVSDWISFIGWACLISAIFIPWRYRNGYRFWRWRIFICFCGGWTIVGRWMTRGRRGVCGQAVERERGVCTCQRRKSWIKYYEKDYGGGKKEVRLIIQWKVGELRVGLYN